MVYYYIITAPLQNLYANISQFLTKVPIIQHFEKIVVENINHFLLFFLPECLPKSLVFRSLFRPRKISFIFYHVTALVSEFSVTVPFFFLRPLGLGLSVSEVSLFFFLPRFDFSTFAGALSPSSTLAIVSADAILAL